VGTTEESAESRRERWTFVVSEIESKRGWTVGGRQRGGFVIGE
jgi:hypothetical protein